MTILLYIVYFLFYFLAGYLVTIVAIFDLIFIIPFACYLIIKTMFKVMKTYIFPSNFLFLCAFSAIIITNLFALKIISNDWFSSLSTLIVLSAYFFSQFCAGFCLLADNDDYSYRFINFSIEKIGYFIVTFTIVSWIFVFIDSFFLKLEYYTVGLELLVTTFLIIISIVYTVWTGEIDN